MVGRVGVAPAAIASPVKSTAAAHSHAAANFVGISTSPRVVLEGANSSGRKRAASTRHAGSFTHNGVGCAAAFGGASLALGGEVRPGGLVPHPPGPQYGVARVTPGPQPRKKAGPFHKVVIAMPSRGSYCLSDLPRSYLIELGCARCGRAGQYRAGPLVKRFGATCSLPDLKNLLAADCPKMTAKHASDPCGVHYLNPWPWG